MSTLGPGPHDGDVGQTGWIEFRGSSSRSRSINIRSPSDQGVALRVCVCVCVSFGVVMCEFVLVTQRLTHQSALVFHGFGHVWSYQDYGNHC